MPTPLVARSPEDPLFGPRPPLPAATARARWRSIAGLCDAAEADYARRSLERLGMRADLTLEAMGFFVCDADLEDELIRALGATAVEAVLDEQGELESFHRFQDQPAQRGRGLDAQLHRFMGTRARRKIRYGALLTDAVALADVPRPLDRVIAQARRQRTQAALEPSG